MTLAARIQNARQAAGLTQATLALRAGVSQQLISKLERGLVEASRYGPAIAKALGLSVEELLEGAEHPSAEEARLLEQYRALSGEGRALAQQLLNSLKRSHPKNPG